MADEISSAQLTRRCGPRIEGGEFRSRDLRQCGCSRQLKAGIDESAGEQRAVLLCVSMGVFVYNPAYLEREDAVPLDPFELSLKGALS
jgi:hypothetical protein